MHLRALVVVVAAGSVLVSGCTTDVYDGVDPTGTSIPVPVPGEYQSETIRFLGEHEGVVYVTVKNADGDPCLILYPDADPRRWVYSCNSTGIVNVGGEFVGEATLYSDGVKRSEYISGTEVSEYLVIDSYGPA